MHGAASVDMRVWSVATKSYPRQPHQGKSINEDNSAASSCARLVPTDNGLSLRQRSCSCN